MERNKISIVLPVFNGEKYIGGAIESILSQTYKNFELIIVDDCSEDTTQTIIREYAKSDKRIKIITNESNMKLPRSLNVGFAATTGEYLTWTSDDNRYHKSALNRMAEILDEMNDIDLVYANFSIVDMDGRLIKEVREGEPEEIRFKNNIGACFLYRRSLAAKVGEYDPKTFLAEDYDFFIRCYMFGKFYHISEDLYDYGRHEGNLTVTRQKEIAHKAFYVMNLHFDFLYSKCNSQKDRNRFFYELLALLKDPRERMYYRGKYYSLDRKFMFFDIKNRMRKTILGILSIPSKQIRGIRKIIIEKSKMRYRL